MKIVANDKLQNLKERQAEQKKMGSDMAKSKQAQDLVKNIKNNWDEEKLGKLDGISLGSVLRSMISKLV